MTRRVRFGLLILSCLSFALSISLTSGVLDPVVSLDRGTRLAFFMMPTRAWQFGVGAVIATMPEASLTHPRSSTARGVAGITLLAVSFAVLDDQLAYPGYWALLPTVATAMLLMAPRGPTARLLSGARVVRAGDLSYSWYLWHWPFIVFTFAAGVDSRIGLAIAGLASYALSSWTYDNVENRFRHASPDRAGRNSWIAITATSVTAASVASVALVAWSARGLPDEAASAHAAREPHASRTCDAVTLGPGVTGCRFGTGPGRLLLVGDSNAGQFTEAAVLAGSELGYAVEVVTEPACPLLALQTSDNGVLNEDCASRTEAVLDWLLSDPPDVVVHSAAADIHLALDGRTLERRGLSGAAAYADALSALADRLSDTGTPVVAVLPVPKFSLEPGAPIGAERCSVASIAAIPTACEAQISRAAADRQRSPGVEAIETALGPTRAVLLDPMPVVCPDDPCTDFSGDYWRYSDARHISTRMAADVHPLIVGAIREAETATS